MTAHFWRLNVFAVGLSYNCENKGKSMKSIITTYPDFQCLPRGIKKMLLASETYFFSAAKSPAVKPRRVASPVGMQHNQSEVLFQTNPVRPPSASAKPS
jgi:hypothetical protein